MMRKTKKKKTQEEEEEEEEEEGEAFFKHRGPSYRPASNKALMARPPKKRTPNL